MRSHNVCTIGKRKIITFLLPSYVRQHDVNKAGNVNIVSILNDGLNDAHIEFRIVVVVLLFYVHGKHLRSCRDGQLTLPHFSWAGLDLLSG